MQNTKTATIKQEKDWIQIQSPYSAAFVEELKEEIPWQARKWEKPNWKVQANHLETVRRLVAKFAQKEGWEVLDYTAQPAEAIEAQKQKASQADLDRHVAAVVAVLPKLPARALRLVDWQTDHLTFELATFLDDKALFQELASASLESYRPTIIYGGSKRQFSHTFIVAADLRILAALAAIAGITPLKDGYGFRSKVEYFVVRDFDLVQQFEDGIAHFSNKEDGSYWIGIQYNRAGIDLSGGHESWQVVQTENTLYMVFEREKIVRDLIAVRESQYVNPGFGNVAVAQSHPSQVASFVKFAHIEEWFRSWGNELVSIEQVKAASFTSKPHWYASSFDHPAEALLYHGSAHRAGSQEMWSLLGWTTEFIASRLEQIKVLKEQAAQAVIDDMRTRSAELALPKLAELTKDDLLELGAKHGVELKKSWSKDRLIQALDASPSVCEDVIGLTKRLQGK